MVQVLQLALQGWHKLAQLHNLTPVSGCGMWVCVQGGGGCEVFLISCFLSTYKFMSLYYFRSSLGSDQCVWWILGRAYSLSASDLLQTSNWRLGTCPHSQFRVLAPSDQIQGLGMRLGCLGMRLGYLGMRLGYLGMRQEWGWVMYLMSSSCSSSWVWPILERTDSNSSPWCRRSQVKVSLLFLFAQARSSVFLLPPKFGTL